MDNQYFVQALYASIVDYEIELSEVTSAGNHLIEVHKTFPEFELSTNQKLNDLRDSHAKLLEKAKSQLVTLRGDLEKFHSLDENLTAIEEWIRSVEGELGQMFDSQLCTSDEWANCESSIRVSFSIGAFIENETCLKVGIFLRLHVFISPDQNFENILL